MRVIAAHFGLHSTAAKDIGIFQQSKVALVSGGGGASARGDDDDDDDAASDDDSFAEGETRRRPTTPSLTVTLAVKGPAPYAPRVNATAGEKDAADAGGPRPLLSLLRDAILTRATRPLDRR